MGGKEEGGRKKDGALLTFGEKGRGSERREQQVRKGKGKSWRGSSLFLLNMFNWGGKGGLCEGEYRRKRREKEKRGKIFV